jgi:hypothetical protein
MGGRDQELGVLRGCAAIAKAIQATPRRTYHLLEKRIIPGRKEDGLWVSTRAELERYYSGDDTAA